MVSRVTRTAARFAAVGLVLIVAAAAQAGPIRFENPDGAGFFEWSVGSGNYSSRLLCVRFDRTAQPFDSNQGGSYKFSFGTLSGQGSICYSDPMNAKSFAEGAIIGPSSGTWKDSGFSNNMGALGSAGTVGYLGFYFRPRDVTQFPWPGWPADPYHYGWIKYRVDTVGSFGRDLSALAWGWETTPDTPVAAGAPEPSSLLLLAMGLTTVSLRRRR